MTTKSREDYLQEATTLLRPVYRKHGYELPEVHVSVGFPSKRATSNKCRRIGECWHGDHQGGKGHIFISPVIAKGVEALEVLVHEHVHAFLPAGVGHGPEFKRAMKPLGLEGKPTATVASKALRAALKKLDKKLGGYAHAALNVNAGKKKQGTRLLKVLCGDCGYNVRVTRIWIDKLGCPICPGCSEQMVEDGKEVQPPTLTLGLKYAAATARS